MKIKIGDKIRVITGKFKKKEGLIKKIDKKLLRVKVEGLTSIKHRKSTQQEKGSIDKILTPIHISNVALLDPKGLIITKVGYKIEKDKKIRFSKKTKKEYKN